MFLLGNTFFVLIKQLGRIIKVFNILLLILFRPIASLADKIFNILALTFFDYLIS